MLLALTEVPVFQSSVSFQVAVSAAKAVGFQIMVWKFLLPGSRMVMVHIFIYL